MSTTAATFPRSQHWTIEDFRISVLFYKRDCPGRCAGCDLFPARHHVWADGHGERERFRGNATFCDEHRPAKGTLPPLDYLRLVRGGMTGPLIYERTEPWPARACAVCGEPPVYRVEHRCDGCGDPGQEYLTQRVALRAEGVTGYAPESHHRPHTLGWDFLCAAHPPEVAA